MATTTHEILPANTSQLSDGQCLELLSRLHCVRELLAYHLGEHGGLTATEIQDAIDILDKEVDS